jgi:hypothetical protein
VSDRFSFCMDNFKKYLPSKNFISLVLLIITFVLIFFIGKGLISLIKNRERKDGAKEPEIVSIKEIIDEDDNNNGIPNWEEYFWGLDPKKDGKKNREFVLAKRELANQNTGNEVKGEPVVLTENEALSRDFFVAMLALSEKGILDEESINAMSETVGQKVIAEPIADKYTMQQILIQKETTIETIQSYYQKITSLIKKYNNEKDLGKEITLMSISISSNDRHAMLTVRSIVQAYRDLAQELLAIETLDILAESHLQMINSCEKIAESIEGLILSEDDSLVGLKSLINYKRYSEEFLSVFDFTD